MTLSKNNTSIISKGLLLKGNLVSDGLLEVEGKIEGNIKGNEITIRESGFIDGNVISNTLNIKGNFSGTIKSQKINISGKATINGTLEYVALCVEDGASIVGDLKRVDEIVLDDDETVLNASKQYTYKKNVLDNTEEENKKRKNKKDKIEKKGKRGRPRKNKQNKDETETIEIQDTTNDNTQTNIQLDTQSEDLHEEQNY